MYVDNHIWTFKDGQKSGNLENEGVPYVQENSKKMVNSGIFGLQDLMAEMSNIDHAKLENRRIFFHGDIDHYASVAFILYSSLYKMFIWSDGKKKRDS